FRRVLFRSHSAQDVLNALNIKKAGFTEAVKVAGTIQAGLGQLLPETPGKAGNHPADKVLFDDWSLVARAVMQKAGQAGGLFHRAAGLPDAELLGQANHDVRNTR